MFWLTLIVTVLAISSVMTAFAEEGEIGQIQIAPTPTPTPTAVTPSGPGTYQTQVFPKVETFKPMCGNGCSSTEDGPECTDWTVAGPGAVCQAIMICSPNGQGEETCSAPKVHALDLGPFRPTYFIVRSNGDTPIEPGDTSFAVLAQAEMEARIQPDQVRRTYTTAPTNVQPYKHIYAADGHDLWLLCEVDNRGADGACDVYNPW
jgi:hypothetical protein